jgi:hypothetical protein
MSAAEITETTELDQVEAWRMEELRRAGYPGDAALQLAGRFDVDLHRAILLLQQGCSPEVALQILL